MNFDLPVLAPSILAADISKLGEQVEICMNEGIQWIHCDVMDGHFVPNICFGPKITEAVRNVAQDAFLDVHMMVQYPDRYVEDYADAGADLISVHYEACMHLHRSIQYIKENGCMAGVVVNPATSVELLKPILRDVDLVLIMTVNPGFGGQSFIEMCYDKITHLYRLRDELQTSFLIQVDGGVTQKNIAKLASKGVDILVSGSSVFKANNIPKAIATLRKNARSGSNKVV